VQPLEIRLGNLKGVEVGGVHVYTVANKTHFYFGDFRHDALLERIETI
jgi:hypothetical protein